MPFQRGVEVVLEVGRGVDGPHWIVVVEGEAAVRLGEGAGTCEELQGVEDRLR